MNDNLKATLGALAKAIGEKVLNDAVRTGLDHFGQELAGTKPLVEHIARQMQVVEEPNTAWETMTEGARAVWIRRATTATQTLLGMVHVDLSQIARLLRR